MLALCFVNDSGSSSSIDGGLVYVSVYSKSA